MEGAAFAMGGAGSIGRWYLAEPRLANPDLAHPTVEGQEAIATLLYRALMLGYAGFRKSREGQPLPSFETPLWASQGVDAGAAR